MNIKKNASKKQQDIKSKLIGATAMLLVSSIMMVSTTYAWFTLSTAPEVTGITTAVGANGNLEMALQPYSGDLDDITSNTSDSLAVKDAVEANVTWGNLVDLSSTATYGLDKITMYPSALNVTGNVINLNPLSTPTYGADGRVSGLATKTITGVYSNGVFAEDIQVNGATVEDAKGVRAVGVSSGMSDRQLAYRAALASASTADTQAKRIASTTLNTNGAVLAEVAIAHALKNDMNGSTEVATYTPVQVAAMTAVLEALLGEYSVTTSGEGDEATKTYTYTSEVDGALEYIENALMQYVLADTLATASDDGYNAIVNEFASLTSTTIANATAFSTSYTKMQTYFTALNTAKNAAETALSKLPVPEDATSNEATYKWSDISNALGGLVNTSYLTINGTAVSDVMADPGALASSIMKNGLTLTMSSGAGVFADIADFCGDYSASITIKELSYGDITVPNVEATMATKTTVNPVYLTQARNAVGDYTTGGSDASSASISDYYGYIIDLAFRTNAADSYLMLQQDAVDRVYSDNTQNEETMGGGAYMSFTPTSTNFTQAAATRLMEAIRIVFFDTDDREIIAYARLDSSKVDPDTSAGIKMPLMLTNSTGTAIVDDPSTTTFNESLAIMELEQNTATALSVLVYLDGNVVGNDDVAYDAVSSMTGTMNLQFASSASLKAMEYADLKTGTGETTPATPSVTDVTASITEGYSATAKYIEGTGIVAMITDSSNNQITSESNVTVTIGGESATYQTVGSYSGWYVAATTAPTGSVAIIVSTTQG